MALDYRSGQPAFLTVDTDQFPSLAVWPGLTVESGCRSAFCTQF